MQKSSHNYIIRIYQRQFCVCFWNALIQDTYSRNEYTAFNQLIDRSPISNKTIVIADRGYESYNVFAHAQEKGLNYIIRVKDINSMGMLRSFNLPSSDEFDVTINLVLTRKQTNNIKSNSKLYKYLSRSAKFDYIDLNNNKFYPMSFRVLRFKISEGSYESIITNIFDPEFDVPTIKLLYHMRWGIETSFRLLKYALGLINFHSKKVSNIIQEIFDKLIMYNFTEIIIANIIISTCSQKYVYKINFASASHVCKHFFASMNIPRPPNVEAVISRHVIPIRPERCFPRKVKLLV